MNSMIEAGGRAIQSAWNDGGTSLPPIDFTPDEEQHLVRAVIQAMIDHGPTEEMLDAAFNCPEYAVAPEGEGRLAAMFTAMLRKALEEQNNG